MSCNSLQERPTEIQDQVLKINKEEELFQWTPTTHPQLERIESTLEPFQQLFSTVFKWQKAEKWFLDGALLEVSVVDTQAVVWGVV